MDAVMSELRALFCEALECPSDEERRAYLDRACGDDQALRSRVEALLAAHHVAGDFLEGPTSPPTGPWHEPATGEPPDTAIGPYRLIERLGEGGMGAVYRAEQTHPVHREVALKLVKRGMDTAQVVARFELERQSLALMDHPSIARVYDAGATDSGRPYFVMELVRGTPITQYCDRERLSILERLELFILVCRAVQHAHQKGIIHRDLKPSNVLVALQDGVPVPKIIDFGVAKATGLGLGLDGTLTSPAQVVGTPLYMSPEQAKLGSRDIDTRSDIYSLGVLLYELLSGTTPFAPDRLKEAALDEICRIIREQEPPHPSTRLNTLTDADRSAISANRHTDPRHLARSLHGELDWIVMKCLEKDRARRYETASALADELMRYLTDEPIEARRPSLVNRAGKWARRHRPVVAAAAILLVITSLGLAIGAALLGHANLVSERRRHEAEANLAQAERNYTLAREAVDRYLTKVSEDKLLNQPHMVKLRQELLETAREFYQRLVDERKDDPPAKADLGNAHLRLSKIARLRADTREAVAQAQAALSIFAGLAAAHPEVADYRRGLATSHNMLGSLYMDTGRVTDAEASYKRALAIREALAKDYPQVADDRMKLADSLTNSGNLYSLNRQMSEAEKSIKRAIGIEEELATAHPEVADYRRGLGRSNELLGRLCFYGTRPLADAEAPYQRALAIREALAKDHPEVTDYRDDLAGNHHNLGNIYKLTGRTAKAEASYQRALAIREALAKEHPEVTDYRRALAGCNHNVGSLYKDTGRKTEAEASYQRAIGIERDLAAAHPDVVLYRRDLARSLDALGFFYNDTGRRTQAEASWKEALAISQKLAADHSEVTEHLKDLAMILSNLGNFYSDTGRKTEAEAPYQRALTIRETLAQQHPEAADYRKELENSHHILGNLYKDTGRTAEAEASYQRAIRIQRELAAAHPEVIYYRRDLTTIIDSLGFVYRDTGRTAQAEASWKEAVAINQKLVADHPEVADHLKDLAQILSNLGSFYSDARRMAEAEASYKRELTIRETLAKDHPEVAEYRRDLAGCNHNLGNLYKDTGRKTEAEASYQRAIGIERDLATAHPEVADYRRDLARTHYTLGFVYNDAGRQIEADASWKEAVAINQKLVADHPEVADHVKDLAGILSSLGNFYSGAGRSTEAEASYQRAIEIFRQFSTAHPDVPEYRQGLAEGLSSLGNLYLRTGRIAEAESLYQRVLAIREAPVTAYPDDFVHRDELANDHNILGICYSHTGRRAEAEASYRRALAIDEKLVASYPDQIEAAISLGGVCCNLGGLLEKHGEPAAALEWCARAIAALEAVLRRDARHTTAREFLRNSYNARAEALSRLGRHAEALADCDRARPLDDDAGHEDCRRILALVLARAGDHRRAAAEAEALAGSGKPAGVTRPGSRDYALARALSRAARAAGEDAGLAPPDRAALAGRHAARAARLLGQARAAGYFANPYDLIALNREPDFDPLRPRADFQALLAAVMDQGFPDNPFAHEVPARGPAGTPPDPAAAAGRIHLRRVAK
jgi:serine/threonine protein kinase/tetratricopeptide (TPR) repeat protein